MVRSTIRGILAKIDRLTDDTMRRFHGEFFTPVKFAKKALDYLEKTIENDWWKSGEYRLWDMAAGTGNLQYNLHYDALPYCYLSTLYKEDVEHCKRLFPNAADIFQYDYLNDDVGNLFTDGQLDFDQMQVRLVNIMGVSDVWNEFCRMVRPNHIEIPLSFKTPEDWKNFEFFDLEYYPVTTPK